jgi:hypothetical protein
MLSVTPRPSRTSQITFTSRPGFRRWYLSCTPDFEESTSTGLPLHSMMLSTSASFIRWTRSMCDQPPGASNRPRSRTDSNSAPRCIGFSSRRATGLLALRISVSALVAL